MAALLARFKKTKGYPLATKRRRSGLSGAVGFEFRSALERQAGDHTYNRFFQHSLKFLATTGCSTNRHDLRRQFCAVCRHQRLRPVAKQFPRLGGMAVHSASRPALRQAPSSQRQARLDRRRRRRFMWCASRSPTLARNKLKRGIS